MTQALPEVLYTSGEILSCLKALFAEPAVDDRRVALVAYVGDGASKYLASPRDLKLICNPSAGGTSPHALRKLIHAGADVQISAKLHAKVMDFGGWFVQPHRGSDPWKLGYWVASPIKPAKSALAKANQEYGADRIADFICTAPGTTKKTDWLLTFQAPEGAVKTVKWLFVDFVVPVSRSDKAALLKDCRFQAIQVFGNRHCPRAPFKITPAFRRAFANAARNYGLEKIEARSDRSLVPPNKLLQNTYDLLDG